MKNEGNPGGVQNSYMNYYKFFRPTPGDKYWLVPYFIVFLAQRMPNNRSDCLMVVFYWGHLMPLENHVRLM